MNLFSEFSGRIIQVTEALDYGDAVSNQVILLDSLLKENGFNSSIYSKWAHDNVTHHRIDINELDAHENDIIIFHFYGYSEYALPVVLDCYATRVMVYHNITPAEFFDTSSPLNEFCRRGREQLRQILSQFHCYWGDSLFNLQELQALGARAIDCHLVPIIVPEAAEISADRPVGEWLFVGRIAPNKGQLHLVELFAAARKIDPKSASHLNLVGGFSTGDKYVQRINKLIDRLELREHVTVTGKVSDDEREAYYRNSSVFVSLSRHEGFGVPLIESANRGLPVLALDQRNR